MRRVVCNPVRSRGFNLVTVLLVICFFEVCFADSDQVEEKSEPKILSEEPGKLFENYYPRQRFRQRRENLGPALSFLIPGLDQWIEGQYSSALFYSGFALLGAGLAIGASLESDNSIGSDFLSGDRQRRFFYGLQLYSWAGGLSGYQSFRSTVNSMGNSKYDFLKSQDESVSDILGAPFRFSYLKRWTTIIPVSAAILASIALTSLSDQKGHFTGEDGFYSLAYSYNAGTYEEAVFRGWLQPMLMTGSISDNSANWIQAILFGLAHLSPENPAPIFQTLFGYYLGWLVQRNQMRVSEGVFIHTWWNVIVIAASFYSLSPQEKKDKKLLIPLFRMSF